MWIIIGLIAFIFAAYMYWVNGRSIFESHSAPTEAEKEQIQRIVSFEQEKLAECKERLTSYNVRASELEIEIRPTLSQYRAVNIHGLVQKHDFKSEFWIPKFYESEIEISIYKNGARLAKWKSHNTTSYFCEFFWLVRVRKQENILELNQRPFNNSYMEFDSIMMNLLDEVSQTVHD